MNEDEEEPCLHCVLSHVMYQYSQQYCPNDSTPMYAALADMVGDLLGDSMEMYEARDKIMASFLERVSDRAKLCVAQPDRNSSIN